MSKVHAPDDDIPGRPDWQSLLLICKDCRRRKNGPRHLKPKALASEIKPLLKISAPESRIVLSTCLKLCPKHATAVAFLDANSTPRIVAVESCRRLDATLSQLTERPS